MTVIKIGGTSGSGKSTLVRGIFDITKQVDSYVSKRGKIIAYERLYGKTPVYILGSYVNACGGMDGISDKNERLALINEYKKKRGITIFEGLIIGGTYGEVGKLSEEEMGEWLYAFMDTPYEVCVERVLARRKLAGNDKPFDPKKTLFGKIRACQSVALRAKAAGHPVHLVDHKQKPEKAAKILLDKACAL